ncbi:MAG TPA: hypothetical protein VMU17_01050, partial [Elusimicrobiota bacterium]|nr:hypothetical protein [Elusimicrobiota bacterium]
PALALGATLDFVGLRRGADIYRGIPAFGNLFDAPVASVLSGRIALGNAFFLQTLAVPTLGSNTPLWSLSNEFWYYVIFPLFVIVCVARVPRTARLGAAAAFGVLAVAIGWTIMRFFTVWLLGASLYFVFLWPAFHRLVGRYHLRWLATLWMFGALLVNRIHVIHPPIVSDLLFGSAVALWIGTLAVPNGDACTRSAAYRSVAGWLAGFAYSLYLLHLPWLVFISTWIVPHHRLQPSSEAMTYFFAMAASAILYAWLIASCTEYHTGAVRDRLSVWLFRKDRLTGGARVANSTERREDSPLAN